jgi:hypothetical protein
MDDDDDDDEEKEREDGWMEGREKHKEREEGMFCYQLEIQNSNGTHKNGTAPTLGFSTNNETETTEKTRDNKTYHHDDRGTPPVYVTPSLLLFKHVVNV